MIGSEGREGEEREREREREGGRGREDGLRWLKEHARSILPLPLHCRLSKEKAAGMRLPVLVGASVRAGRI